MCLIVLAWRASPKARLVVAANRDEFFARGAAPAAWWRTRRTFSPGATSRRAGRGWESRERAGSPRSRTSGTRRSRRKMARLRVALSVADFLKGRASAVEYVGSVRPGAGRYHGFNLLVSDGTELWSFSNVEGDPVRLPPGIWGLSNHLIETPWPKVTAASARLEAALGEARGAEDLERRLLALLEDRGVAPDGALPDTGLPLSWERALSAAFVVLPDYGTRASTSLIVAPDGAVRFAEARFGRGGAPLGEVREAFRFSATP